MLTCIDDELRNVSDWSGRVRTFGGGGVRGVTSVESGAEMREGS